MDLHKPQTKILTFVPVYPHLPASVAASIEGQTFKGENDLFLSLYDPHPTNHPEWGRNLVFKQKKAREICLLCDYSHLFMVESDVIPPRNTLELLLSMDAPVCCGWYRLNHGELAGKTTIIQRWMKCEVKFSGPTSSVIGFSEQVECLEPNTNFKPGDTINLDMCIFGCTLIRRDVLEDFNFDVGIDATFSNYCNEHLIPMLCNTSIYCEHLNLRENP